MNSKLGKRLALTLLTVALGAIALAGFLINISISKQFYGYVRDNHTAREARVVQGVVSLYSRYNDWNRVSERLQGINLLMGMRFTIVDDRGYVVFSTDDDVKSHQKMVDTGQASRTPIVSAGMRVGTIFVSSQGASSGNWNKHDEAFSRTIKLSTLIAGVVAGIGAIWASLRLARQFTKPLDELTQAVSAYGDGNLETRVTLTSDDEIGQLGKTFNDMAERLQNMDYLRKKQAADISHELRTPLTVLQGLIEAVQDGIIQSSPETMDSMHDEVICLSQLVDDLRELSLLENHGRRLDLAIADISCLIAGTVEDMKALFDTKGISVALYQVDSPLLVKVDTLAMDKVMRNILVNALRYTDSGGRVSVRVFSRDGLAHVEIDDTGMGIPASELPFIFERFYRADASRTRDTGGTGIGLAIAKELIEAQTGSLTATSTPGEGSTFTIKLPLLREL